MKIKIAEKLRPFSHRAGIESLIPSTHWKVTCFPTRLVFSDLFSESVLTVDFDLKGPFQNFTCMQNLEKGILEIFGKTPQGNFCFSLFPHKDGIDLEAKRLFKQGVTCRVIGKQIWICEKLQAKSRFTIPIKLNTLSTFSNLSQRLSLGSHKKQDWDLMLRRCDMKEIFPIWLKLGEMILCEDYEKNLSKSSFLKNLEEVVEEKKKAKVLVHFRDFFKLAFRGMMIPTLFDQTFSGVLPFGESIATTSNPLVLLKKGAELIRGLFLRHTDKGLEILPCLPNDFSCGRYIHLHCDELGVVDLDWSKQKIKKFILKATTKKNVQIQFQNFLKRCRLRQNLKEKGKEFINGEILQIRPGITYFFDRFEK